MHIISPMDKPPSNAWSQKLTPVSVERAPTIYCLETTESQKPKRKRIKRKPKLRKPHYRKVTSLSNRESAMYNYWQAIWTDPGYCENLNQNCLYYQENQQYHNQENYQPETLQEYYTNNDGVHKCSHYMEDQLSGSQVESLVINQLAYYFSRDNLLKDIHLRGMFHREDGTVLLSELIKFAKLKSLLGEDIKRLMQIARKCSFVELIDDGRTENTRVRTHDWHFWILEMAPKEQMN